MIILVDKHDHPIGIEEKLKVHQLGLLHRAFSVFVFRNGEQPELLIQQRHPAKYHCGGLWTNTCCSHPRPHENTYSAAQRRLQEEMGLDLPLTYCGAFQYRAEFDNGLVEHEYDHVYFSTVEECEVTLHPEEVSDYRWVELQALKKNISANPEEYTPWFGQALEIAENRLFFSSF